MAGFAFGIDSSAGFGEVLFACGGLWTRSLDENLEDILENQEPLLCGEVPGGGDRFSSELVLEKDGRAGVACFDGICFVGVGESIAVSFVVAVGGKESADIGLAESRVC